MVRRRCNIQKYKFICTGSVISSCNLYRITGIFQIYKINTFYHPAIIHIQAGNDPFCKHIFSSFLCVLLKSLWQADKILKDLKSCLTALFRMELAGIKITFFHRCMDMGSILCCCCHYIFRSCFQIIGMDKIYIASIWNSLKQSGVGIDL